MSDIERYIDSLPIEISSTIVLEEFIALRRMYVNARELNKHVDMTSRNILRCLNELWECGVLKPNGHSLSADTLWEIQDPRLLQHLEITQPFWADHTNKTEVTYG